MGPALRLPLQGLLLLLLLRINMGFVVVSMRSIALRVIVIRGRQCHNVSIAIIGISSLQCFGAPLLS